MPRDSWDAITGLSYALSLLHGQIPGEEPVVMARGTRLGKGSPGNTVVLGAKVELDVVPDLRRDDIGLESERGLRDGIDTVGCHAGLRRGDSAENGEGAGRLHLIVICFSGLSNYLGWSSGYLRVEGYCDGDYVYVTNSSRQEGYTTHDRGGAMNLYMFAWTEFHPSYPGP